MKIYPNERYDIIALLSEDKQVRVTYIKSDGGFTPEKLNNYYKSYYKYGKGSERIRGKLALGKKLTAIQALHYYYDTEGVLKAKYVLGSEAMRMIEEYYAEYEAQGYTIVRSQGMSYSGVAVEMDEVVDVVGVKYKLAPDFELSVANALEIAAVAVEAGIKQYQLGRQEMYNEFLAYFNSATASSFPKP